MWNICSYPLLYSIIYHYYCHCCWFIEGLYYEYETLSDIGILSSFCHPEMCICHSLRGDFWWEVVLTVFQWIIIFYLFFLLCLISYIHLTLNSIHMLLLLFHVDFGKKCIIILCLRGRLRHFDHLDLNPTFYLSTL